jgi:ketopantoate hydroxymethyltransferase
VKEAGAEAVKIEGPRVELVRALTEAEIPVVGHLGLTPQSVHRMGGYRVQAQDGGDRAATAADALALAEAGAGAIVLEGVPREMAARLLRSLHSDDWDWGGAGVRWADSGVARHSEPDLCAACEVCAAVCGCGR